MSYLWNVSFHFNIMGLLLKEMIYSQKERISFKEMFLATTPLPLLSATTSKNIFQEAVAQFASCERPQTESSWHLIRLPDVLRLRLRPVVFFFR